MFYNKDEKRKLNKVNMEVGDIDDTNQYGEFVSSYFAWLTLEKQKDNAKRMENMTKKKNKE